MSTGKLGVVVSYSSNEKQFLVPQLRQLIKCADHIVYSVGSRLYDMRDEDPSYLHHVIGVMDASHKVSVARYDVREDVEQFPRKYHNLARASGVSALAPDIEWVLLLDADEIPDGAALASWFAENSKHLFPRMAYKMACYWYFVKPTWRSQTHEDSVLLVHRTNLTKDALSDARERDGIVLSACPGGCMHFLADKDGTPLFHHFSWVRNKEQILHKVRTWGHRHDRVDWVDLVEHLWHADRPPPQGDFVHGYKYDVVGDRFGIGVQSNQTKN